jgi:hypothetical protein
MNLFYISLLSIAVSLLASLSVYFQRKDEFYLRMFPPFLLLTLLIESNSMFGLVSRKYTTPMYNVFSIIEFIFYIFILGLIVKNVRAKRLIKYVVLVFGILAVGNIIFFQKISGFPSLNHAAGCLLIVAICIYYFFELFQISQSVPLVRQPSFWICSGLLFFYCCSFPIFTAINLLRTLPPFTIKTLVTIISILNVLLYSSFTIAFLCRLKTRNSTSLS